MKRTYSIGDLAEITGVSKRQLRGWERKGYIQPSRIRYGEREHRRYSDEDLGLVIKMKKFLDEGFTLAASAQKAAGLPSGQGGGDYA